MEQKDIPLTDGVYFLLAKSILEAVRLHSTPPCGPHILMSIPKQPPTFAKKILDNLGIDVEKLHGVIKDIFQKSEAHTLQSECVLAIIKHASLNGNARKCGFVSDEHLLLAILELGGPIVQPGIRADGCSSTDGARKNQVIIIDSELVGINKCKQDGFLMTSQGDAAYDYLRIVILRAYPTCNTCHPGLRLAGAV